MRECIFTELIIVIIMMIPMITMITMITMTFCRDCPVGNGFATLFKLQACIWAMVLMNFQEHATHHQHPEIPWYELPEKRAPLPDDYAQRNRSGLSFFRAVFQQLKGPNLVYDDPVSPR